MAASIMSYSVIANMDDTIRLSVGIDTEDGTLYMPSITFDSTKKSWDNSDFIYNEFYEFLERWKNRKLNEEDTEFAASIIKDCLPENQDFTEEWVTDVLAILDHSIYLQWNEVE